MDYSHLGKLYGEMSQEEFSLIKREDLATEARADYDGEVARRATPEWREGVRRRTEAERERERASNVSGSSVAETPQNRVTGAVLLVLWIMPIILGAAGLFGLGVKSQRYYRDLAALAAPQRANRLSDAERAHLGFTAKQTGTFDQREELHRLLASDAKLWDIFVVTLSPLYLLPLALLGTRRCLGSAHHWFSWQRQRIKRRPALAYLPWLFAVAFLQNGITRFLNPFGSAGLGEFALGLVCLGVALWFYFGREPRPDPTLSR